MKSFFYKYWWLYYLLFFILLGILIYAILWKPNYSRYNHTINELTRHLDSCKGTSNASIAQPRQTVDCNAEVHSGGQGETITRHELGKNPGLVSIEYNMLTLPDQITIQYNDSVVASSKELVSGYGDLNFNYKAEKGKPTYCVVKISAPYSQTEWNYMVNCPK